MVAFDVLGKIRKGHSGWCLVLVILGCLRFHTDAFAIGQAQHVHSLAEQGGFPIAQGNQIATIHLDAADWPGVIRAAGDLQSDIGRVTGHTPKISSDSDSDINCQNRGKR